MSPRPGYLHSRLRQNKVLQCYGDKESLSKRLVKPYHVVYVLFLKQFYCKSLTGKLGVSSLNEFLMYLTTLERTRVVSKRGASLCTRRVPHEVPQGSVLGPTLFLVAINHIMNSLIGYSAVSLQTTSICLAEGRLLHW